VLRHGLYILKPRLLWAAENGIRARVRPHYNDLRDGGARADGDETRVRWDILQFQAPNTLLAGGSASSTAIDGSKITLTGSGTFKLHDPGDARGGGNWQTEDSHGAITGSGTYSVTSLDSFAMAPGPSWERDSTTVLETSLTHTQVWILHILYSDLTRGVLVVSCTLDGTPADIFEGITATKGAVDFATFVGHGTLFHISAED
jgi:hypothetical protein